MHTTRNSCRDTVPCNMALKLSQYFYLLREASWSLLPSLVSLVAGSTVQPENTYSCILKVSGHIVHIQERIRSNQDFGWELARQMVVSFFRWDLKTPSIKSSEYISQAKKIKKIPIVMSTISHFWSPSLTILWQWVVYLYHYFPWYILPPPHKYFFCGELKFFSHLVVRAWEYFKFLGGFLYWGVLTSFLGEGAQAIFFHKAINDQSCKLKNS